MKKKYGLLKSFFWVSALFLLFSCSVSEDDSGKFQTLSICIPSSKTIVDRPSNIYDIPPEIVDPEWYEYSKLELFSATGSLLQEINDFHFGTPYSMIVTEGLYELKASVVMGKLHGDYDCIIAVTYVGKTLVNVEADKELTPVVFNITKINEELLDSEDTYIDDPMRFLPVDIEVQFYVSLDPSAMPVDGITERPLYTTTLSQVVSPRVHYSFFADSFNGRTVSYDDINYGPQLQTIISADDYQIYVIYTANIPGYSGMNNYVGTADNGGYGYLFRTKYGCKHVMKVSLSLGH